MLCRMLLGAMFVFLFFVGSISCTGKLRSCDEFVRYLEKTPLLGGAKRIERDADENITSVNVAGMKMSSMGWDCILGMSKLEKLMVQDVRLDVDLLHRLKGLRKLKYLSVSSVSSEELKVMREMDNLSSLIIYDSVISEKEANQLAEFEQLRRLFLLGKSVDATAILKLTQAPRLKHLTVQVEDIGDQQKAQIRNIRPSLEVNFEHVQ